MSDIYAAPMAELKESVPLEGYGSLERAVSGDYEFNVGDTIGEAWVKTKGAKGTLHLAFFLYVIVYAALTVGLELLFSALGFPMSFLPGIVVGMLSVPLGAGLFLLGARRAADAPLSSTRIFYYFDKTLPLLATVVLMYLFIVLGFIVFILPGIYLSLAYYMAVPLVVEKGLSPWQALEG